MAVRLWPWRLSRDQATSNTGFEVRTGKLAAFAFTSRLRTQASRFNCVWCYELRATQAEKEPSQGMQAVGHPNFVKSTKCRARRPLLGFRVLACGFRVLKRRPCQAADSFPLTSPFPHHALADSEMLHSICGRAVVVAVCDAFLSIGEQRRRIYTSTSAPGRCT